MWIQQLEIAVREDLSSHVNIIVLESQQSIAATTGGQGTASVDEFEQFASKDCGFATEGFSPPRDFGVNARGYRISRDYADKNDLQYATTCIIRAIPYSATDIGVKQVEVNHDLFGSNYELRVELPYLALSRVRSVKVTLPGQIESVQPIVSPPTIPVSFSTEVLQPDTIIWKVITPELWTVQPTPTFTPSPGPGTPTPEPTPTLPLPTPNPTQIAETIAILTALPNAKVLLVGRSYKASALAYMLPASAILITVIGLMAGIGVLRHSRRGASKLQQRGDVISIRQVLAERFSDEEIESLCFDHFRKVYDAFSTGMTKTAKIQKLLEYCDHQDQLGLLSEIIRRERPDI
jgi:hypothetical protein